MSKESKSDDEGILDYVGKKAVRTAADAAVAAGVATAAIALLPAAIKFIGVKAAVGVAAAVGSAVKSVFKD